MEHLPEPPRPPSHYESVITDWQESAKPVKLEAFDYMKFLTGWCSQSKASILIDIVLKARPDKIVEIGVWGGKSLIPMACALRTNGKGKIYGIDPWDSNASIEWVKEEVSRDWWGQQDHEKILQDLIDKISLFNLEDYIDLIRTSSETADPIQDIDILHIDGNHSEETSYLDVTKWVPLVKSGGWIILDDMTWTEKGINTTGKAAAWLDEHCNKIAELKDQCVWGIWVKR